MDVFGLATIVALIYTVITFLRNVVNLGNDPSAKSTVLTQLIVWVSAVAILALAAQAQIAQSIDFMGRPLGDMDFTSLVLVGLAFGSSASSFNDFLASRDEYRSSDNPPLLGAKEALRASRAGDSG